jgi:hypothetical protein
MKASRHGVLIRRWLAVLCIAGFALFVLKLATARKPRVVFSNGSWLSIRKVTYGKNNVYYHNPLRRGVAALVSDSVWNRAFDQWLSKAGVSSVNSEILAQDDYLAVFADFHFAPDGTRFWEFTGIDGSGVESGPLETTLMDDASGPTTSGPCIVADGTNVANRWPLAVRIYERATNGTRKLLAEVPAQRSP